MEDARSIVRWYHVNLAECMELYAVTSNDGRNSTSYMLVENYCCNIVTTSRIYIDPKSGRELLMPPNAWISPFVTWKVDRESTNYRVNACNTYTFENFRDFIVYIGIVRATKDTVPFLTLRDQLREEAVAKLIDADIEPPPTTRIKRQKIYIS